MENQRGLTIVLWMVVLFGAFFLARGITGNVIMNTYTASDYCSYDKDCATAKICCNGMCIDSKTCEEFNNFQKEKPQIQKNIFLDIGMGLLILIAVLIAFYANSKKIGKEMKEVKKLKKRNRKKR